MAENTGYDKTPVPAPDYDVSKVPEPIRRRSNWTRTKFTGQNVLESVAQVGEIAGLYAGEALEIVQKTEKRQDELEQYTDQMIVEMTGKDIISAPEIIQARDGSKTLDDRLARDYEAITTGTENLLYNSDLSAMPETEVPNGSYSFLIAEGSGPANNERALVVMTTNYQAGREFAFVLKESVPAGADLVLKAWVRSNVDTQQFKMRMAKTTEATEYTIAAKGAWKWVELTLTTPDDYDANDFLYINTGGTSVLEFSNLSVQVKAEVAPKSLAYMAKRFETLNFSNSKGAIESMIATAQTYQDNLAQLVYGNFKTAYDADPTAVNGKYQIDCSSFASLLVQGVPFSHTRYKKDKNTKARWGFDGYDPSVIRYSNQIAKWAYDRGYAFKPEPDFSNVQPGDFVFYRWNDFTGEPSFRRRAFMEIDHVGVYLDKQSDSEYKMLQLDNGFSSVHFNASGTYMSQAVLVARFPMANVESSLPNDNMVLDANTPKSTSISSTVNVYKLKKPLKKGKYYTAVLDGKINTPDAYFVLQNERYETIASEIHHSDKAKRTFRFLYQGEEANGLAVSIGAPGGTPTSRNASVNWIKLVEGYSINEEQTTELQVKRNITLPDGLNQALKPYATYLKSDNLVNIELSLPFSSAKTGRFIIDTLPTDARPKAEVRIPALLQSTNGGVHMGAISVYAEGPLSIIPYTSEPYNNVLATGAYSLI